MTNLNCISKKKKETAVNNLDCFHKYVQYHIHFYGKKTLFYEITFTSI